MSTGPTTETTPQTSASEGVNIEGTATGAGTPAATTEAPKGKTFTQAELDDIIKGRLADQKKAIEKTAEEKRATEQGEWKTLAESRGTDLDKAKADLTVAEAERTALETRLHAIADERTKELPEKLRERVPAADKATAVARVEKIEELLAVLAEVPHAAIPHGNGRGPKPAGPPTPEAALVEAKQRLRREGGYTGF